VRWPTPEKLHRRDRLFLRDLGASALYRRLVPENRRGQHPFASKLCTACGG